MRHRFLHTAAAFYYPKKGKLKLTFRLRLKQLELEASCPDIRTEINQNITKAQNLYSIWLSKWFNWLVQFFFFFVCVCSILFLGCQRWMTSLHSIDHKSTNNLGEKGYITHTHTHTQKKRRGGGLTLPDGTKDEMAISTWVRVHLLFMSGHQHQTMSNRSESNNNNNYNYNKKRKTRAFPGHVNSLIVQWATDVSACQMQTEMSQKKKRRRRMDKKKFKMKKRDCWKKFPYVGGKMCAEGATGKRLQLPTAFVMNDDGKSGSNSSSRRAVERQAFPWTNQLHCEKKHFLARKKASQN